MLTSFMYSLNATLPIFLLVVLGVLLKKYGKLTDSFTDAADWIVFKIALPVTLFLDVASCSISESFDIKLTLFLVVVLTAVFAIVSLITVLTVRDNSKRGAFVQGTCRSSVAILGVPLAVNMFGESGGQTMAVAIPFVIILLNVYSVIVLSVFSGDEKHRMNKAAVLDMLKKVVTNPLIIGVVLGIPFMLFDIELFTVADRTLTYLSGLTTPLALLSLGAGLKAESLRGRAGFAVIGAVGKTVIIPAVAVTAAALMGFRGIPLGVVLICFGSPTAVPSYIMAKKMDNDHDLAAQILLLSTLFSVVTIFIGIFILKTLALI